MTRLLKKSYLVLLKILVFVLIVFSMLFARPFIGLMIFGYPLGYFLTFLGLMLSLIFLFLPKRYSNFFYFNDMHYYSLKGIIFSFFVINTLNGGDFLNPYTYKSSSYIWTAGFIFLGILISSDLEIKNEYFFLILSIIPLFTYLFASGNYPNRIINFFILNSDKFQFLKASDLFLGYISVNFLLKYFLKSQNLRFLYFLCSSALLLPIMLFSSRGSFVGVLIYMIFELFYSRRYILSNRIRVAIYLMISLLFFSVSVLRIDNSELSRASVDQLFENATEVSSSLENIASKKDNVNVWFSFYWHYGRLESTDPTTNWRLDIWQDVVYDIIDENKIFTGYGYNEVFPQMLDPTAPGRLGKDGMNENIHNYFVNIFARGGLIQFILFLSFHLGLVFYWKEKSNNYQILMYIIPSFFVSSLDITMEGVQYPLVYYFFLYYFLKNSTKVKVVELYG